MTNWWSGMIEPLPPHTHTHSHRLTHACINLTAEKHSGLTSSTQPSNPQANYKPHYVLSVPSPHHINSAMCSDRLRTGVERHRREEMSPVDTHDFQSFKLFSSKLFFNVFPTQSTNITY